MDYTEFAPSSTLRPFVRCYWTLTAPIRATTDATDAVAPEPALPDGSPEFIVNAADPFTAHRRDSPHAERQAQAILVGQITKPFAVAPTGRVELFAVRFRPHGASLIADDMAAITNDWIDVDQLPVRGLTDLTREILHAVNPDARIAACDRVLSALLIDRPPDPDVHAAVDAIEESSGTLALDELAATLRRSPRHLQRQFARTVGISPKLLARIRRFQRVFAAWRDDPSSLARVAAECGYFDQPHLIKDFRDFAGHAPSAFLANQPEFTQLFLPNARR
ncbi:MAG: helix-turn-helix transcriptional regulator [Gemmatimonadaceae bacterium]|nr:helix-turn-helix transcriptional regulator [Gemmatimonadaceae bacterium]